MNLVSDILAACRCFHNAATNSNAVAGANDDGHSRFEIIINTLGIFLVKKPFVSKRVKFLFLIRWDTIVCHMVFLNIGSKKKD